MWPHLLPKQPQDLAVARQYILALSACLPFAVSGSMVAWPSPTLPRIVRGEGPVRLDVSEISWMVSLLFLGSLTSPGLASYLADTFGRRKVLLYNGILPILSWLLVIFATDPEHLYLARFLAGLQYGIASTIQPVYIGEIAQPDIRGTLSSLNALFFGSGNLLVFVVGPYVSYYTLGILSLILPSLFIVTFMYMPDSPYYLVKKNKIDKARESLLWLRGDLNRIELEIELNQIEMHIQNKLERTGTFLEIFTSKASRKAIIISTVFSAVKRLTGTGVVQAYATLTLPQKTFGWLSPDTCVMVLGIVTVLSSVFATCLADRCKRRLLLIISCSGCAVSTFTIAIWYFLEDKTTLDMGPVTFVPFIGFLVQAIFYNLACGPIGATIKGELFPTHVRAKCSAIATTTAALTSFILNKSYLLLARWEGVYLNYIIFTVSCVLGALFTILYVPETKGKTLQEIQEILTGEKRQKIPTYY